MTIPGCLPARRLRGTLVAGWLDRFEQGLGLRAIVAAAIRASKNRPTDVLKVGSLDTLWSTTPAASSNANLNRSICCSTV